MHLLIVDDQSSRLHALERALLELRPDWDVVALEDPAVLADVLAGRAFDAAVIHLESSRAATRDLLEQCGAIAPGMMRFAVLRYAADADAIGQLDLAHRVMTTPLEPGDLTTALDMVNRLAAMLDDPRLRREITALGKLPAPPGIALSLMSLATDPNSDSSRIIELLRGSPAVTAKVLQLSNSALYNRGSPIVDLGQALVRLGMDTLIGVVLAAEAFGEVGSPQAQASLQQRALLGAQIATRLLRGLGAEAAGLNPGMVATAATLAEIGRLLPLRNEAVADLFAGDEWDAQDLPPAHSVAGAYLLHLWALPREIVNAVAWQARPAQAHEDAFGTTTAVHVAHALAAGLPLDRRLLAAQGMDGHVEDWEALAERLDAPPRPTASAEGVYELDLDDAELENSFTFY
ncbi:HDOD domain-containing protein [Coralloluteibacterium stylophorae]|uniref:HDOD domain-containing protein n=1 Tax=Coralloluteibacterium stylophorae TaxID=1776034 RepID=A0A8J7VU28_9GAMM|nr:HDOD domain-containing protein [Coralloluteibacterium stylophorae]MBS7457237.1 HDOD domain-containing protein [Coralloluteibacterium stylophorae]